jgi:hypothetical protein
MKVSKAIIDVNEAIKELHCEDKKTVLESVLKNIKKKELPSIDYILKRRKEFNEHWSR